MPAVVRLSRRGRALRLAAAGFVLAGLAYGTVLGTDDHFPFGPLTQYAFAADPNGTVPDLYIEADTTAGTRVKVNLSSTGVGIGRAEIEGQLDEIRRDPSRLQAVAEAQHRLHPGEPRYVRLYLRIRHTRLRNGLPVSDEVEDVTEWVVR
jgi:hypothetical protein